jgi:phosphopantetheinyl transferase
MPIFWSFQKIDQRIGQSDPADIYQYLGEHEKAALQKLKVAKRKQEWLAARLIIKDLVRKADDRWKHKELHEIEVWNKENGAPHLVIAGSQANLTKVSLSHSNGYVLCAYSAVNVQLGVDLELIEPRSREFVQDFFTVNELDQIDKMDVLERNLFITVIWSGKESVLKALSLGLRVDTRSIEVSLRAPSDEHNGWNGLGLKSNLIKNDTLSLVWRRDGDFVLTGCIPSNCLEGLIRIAL